MDINLAVLNIGNSRLATGVFIAGKLEQVRRIALSAGNDWQGAIAEAWRQLEGTKQPAVVAASVNPLLVGPVEECVQRLNSQPIQWVGRDVDVPIKVLTDNPEQTGIDRILNVAAAYEQMQKACAVVDAGTAITVDVCNDGGEFLGGAIAAGASMMLEALHERTAQLPAVGYTAPSEVFGRSTRQAMLLGVHHGIRGMVKELVERYAMELGTWPELIATGGDAQALFEGWELVHAIAPDLTLYGIALAYVQHHSKHGT
jgi:type III pantothenate kinase